MEFIVATHIANITIFFASLPHDATEPLFGELSAANRSVAGRYIT